MSRKLKKQLAIVLAVLALISVSVIVQLKLHPKNTVGGQRGQIKTNDVQTVSNAAPDGFYTVLVTNVGPGQSQVSIVTKDGKFMPNIITKEEAQRLVLDRLPQAYNVSFGKWLDNDTFQLIVQYKDGPKFQYEVDAKTGKGDPNTFKVVE